MGRLKSDGTQVPGSREGRFGTVLVSLRLLLACDFVIASSIDLMSPTAAQMKTAEKKITTRDDGKNSLMLDIMVNEG